MVTVGPFALISAPLLKLAMYSINFWVNSFTAWGHQLGCPHICPSPPFDWERHIFLLPADKNADVMAGAGTAIFDQEANLRMESMNSRITRQKQESLRTAASTASTCRLLATKLVYATVTLNGRFWCQET